MVFSYSTDIERKMIRIEPPWASCAADSLSANCRRAFFAYSSTYYAPEALPYVRGWIEAAEGLCIKIRGRIGLRMKTDRSVEIENRYQLRFRLYFF